VNILPFTGISLLCDFVFLPTYMKVDIYLQTLDLHMVKQFGFPCLITGMPRKKKVKTVKNAKGSIDIMFLCCSILNQFW
jgi:hypothetical protein